MSDESPERVTEQTGSHEATDAAGYWKATLRLTVALLLVWFAVSYGAGILFRDALDHYHIGGAPLGFWFAQQGSIYVFVILIFVYCWGMNRLERKFRIGDANTSDGVE